MKYKFKKGDKIISTYGLSAGISGSMWDGLKTITHIKYEHYHIRSKLGIGAFPIENADKTYFKKATKKQIKIYKEALIENEI